MPRGVDDVDLDTFVTDGDVLGEDSDAALALQVVAVQYLCARLLIGAEDVARHEHLVYKGGLSVVYVGNNCDVTYVLHLFICLFNSRAKLLLFSKSSPPRKQS